MSIDNPTTLHHVSGRVSDTNNVPQDGLLVSVYDRDMRNEELIGETRTTRNGRYQLDYHPAKFLRGEKKYPDLAVKVFTSDGKQLLYEPPLQDIRFNAHVREVIDIRLQREVPREADEYRRYLRILEPLRGEVPVHELDENEKVQDVNFLSRETEIKAERLEYLVVAHRLQAEYELPATVAYGLFRMETLVRRDMKDLLRVRFQVGLDTELQTLLYDLALLDEKKARADLKRAAKQRIIPPKTVNEYQKAQEILDKYRKEAEEFNQKEKPQRVLNLMAGFLLEDKINLVSDLLTRSGGDMGKFIQTLGQHKVFETEESKQQAEASLLLGSLLGYNEKLTDKIKKEANVRQADDLKKLVSLNTKEWKALWTKVTGEGIAKSKTLRKKVVDFHARTLMKNLEGRYPAEAYVKHLSADKKPSPQTSEVATFLKKQKNFSLKETRLDAYFNEKKLTSEQDESLKAELKKHQRLFRLTPQYQQAKGLMEQGIHSAQGIVAVGRGRFLREIAPQASLSQQEAAKVFARAEATHTATLLVAADLNDMHTATHVPALATKAAAEKLGKVGEDFPSLKNLFQLTDTCECEHCRSVYSPAAYLVELLQFLDKRLVTDTTTTPPTTGRVAKDAFFERRPDLGDLDLSCDNANVPVPYIDLVCEVLEAYVSPDPGVSFSGVVAAGGLTNVLLTALTNAGFNVTDQAQLFPPDVNGDYILRDKNIVLKLHNTGSNNWNIKELRQTYGTAAELAASPYYVNEAAYTLLKNSVYAFGLPFDLAHTEAKAYFDRFGIARATLMETLQTGGSPAAIDMVAERLGVTRQQKDIIVTPKPDASSQKAYWNTTGSATSELKVVATMLDKTGLTYKELEELLGLKFFNANLFIKHLDESCDLAQKTIENLNVKVLDRLHRLLRLHKATGWAFPVLDALIASADLGNKKLDEDCLLKMGQLLKIKEQTGLTVEELSGCYGDIPHETNSNEQYVPLYQQVFLNKATQGVLEEGLLPENIDGSTLLSDYKTAIALALQLSEADIDLLTGAMANTDLTWANLSYLYASARFCDRRKLTVEDYLVYQELTGVAPFASPADTLAFIDYLERAKNATLAPADVKFMLHHEAEDLDARIISDEKIQEILGLLQENYVAAYQTNQSPYDASWSIEELSGALKELLLRLPATTEEKANHLVAMALGEYGGTDPEADALIDDTLSDYLGDTNPVKMARAAIDPSEDNADPTAAPTKQAFVQSMLDPLAAFFYALDKENTLVTVLAETFRQEEALVSAVMLSGELGQPGGDLLLDLLTDDSLIDVSDPENVSVVDEASYPQQYDALRLLHKMLPLVASLPLPATDLAWWLLSANAMGWLSPDTIPYQSGQTSASYEEWLALSGMVAISSHYPPLENPADPDQPFTFLATLDLLIGGVGAAEWLDQLAVITGHDRQQLEDLDGHFGWSTPDLAAYQDPKTWTRLEESLGYVRKMNVSVPQAVAIAQAELTTIDTATLRAALKTRYSEALWLETLKEIMDTIRPQKRDALVAYILSENAAVTATSDLYDFYLLDVEMEACMPSSRIVQAHGVIQLFAQRCLMGIEPETAADTVSDPAWEQWEWMKMYRVWEANRKVFLYPENWIEPELLDDKSYLFAELENELLQNELNEFTAEEAIIRYVERLDDISFLEVMATYYETEVYTMHVFARSKGGDPPQYYYRRFEGERYWTPWEKVPLEISANQVLAFKRNSRLHLAWPIFTEETNEDQIPTTPAITNVDNTPANKINIPEKRLKIQLAISQYANDQWKPKKISQDAIVTDYTTNHAELNQNQYNLIYNPFASAILVFHSNWDNNQEYHTQDGIFSIAGCQGYPEILSTAQHYLPDFFPDISDAYLKPQRYFEQGAFEGPDNLFILHVLSFFGLHERLHKTPGLFRITHPFQLNLFDIIAYIFLLMFKAAFGKTDLLSRLVKLPFGTLFPYFFEDSDHAYVAVPGLYRNDEDEQGNELTIRRTFSDIHQLLVDIVALLTKYVSIYQENQDAAATLEQLKDDPDYLHVVEEIEIYKTLSVGEAWQNFYYPMMCRLRTVLYNDGVAGIMKRELQLEQTSFNFGSYYEPSPRLVTPYPAEDFDFRSDASYSAYNWELFYHTPLMIANRLRDDQKFDEAFRWYHYMFNPTGTLDGEVPNKYWVTKPFFQHTQSDYVNQRIDTLLYKVATPGTPEMAELEFAISQWRVKPFRPHTVARFRPVAYQKTLLMNYLQALIDCGDYHFRLDTMESIVQATQYYMLAHKLLGSKPRVVPPVVKPPYQTYNQIEADLDAFGNALVALENLIPDISSLPQGGDELPPAPETLASLYFCIPLNEKMLGYWDTLEDRLWKIRHCRNIDGVERTLALFAPPIDPGALVKAAAAGLDISSVIAGMNAPLPHYRFTTLAQKATELVQEVRSLGNALLQALEKKDAEEMALLQNSLERSVLQQMRDVKALQIEEATEQIEVLNRTKETTQERYDYYASIEKIIANEQLNLDKLVEGQDFQMAAQIVQATGAILGLIPDFNIGGHGAGGSPAFHATFGGSFLAEAANAAASVLNILSSAANYQANRASILGGYDRRWEDWKLQERTSEKELRQIDQQIVVAEITKQRSEKELENHDIQIENNEETETFMRDKYTNKELYQWMIGEISSVYFRAYSMAYDLAKKAEKSYQHELGNTDTYIDFGYWDSLKKGLLTSDQLLYDIKRMEVSYLEKNRREYEVTKHVSLDMLDPLALSKLRATGACDFEVPEALYDMDHPGHYFRRIKSVSISIPCIAGPYTSVSGKLSLVTNRYRKNTDKAQGAATSLEEYQEASGNDNRFIYNVGTIQSIATSGAQNDSGLFEFNFRDERYLPFEGTGAISVWRFELPEMRQFDYHTIRDIILHVKYTAREGGSTLRSLASSTLADKVDSIAQELGKTGLHKSISLRHEMPNEWHLLTTTGEALTTIGKERLPYFAQPLSTSISNVIFLARVEGNPATVTLQIDDADLSLNRNDTWQLCIGETNAISLDTQWKLNVAEADQAKLLDLLIVVKYELDA